MEDSSGVKQVKKVLLMGRNNAGKTSMRSIIFANYLAKHTIRLGFTNYVNESRLRFMGDLVLNLWDCGGQDEFMKNYFNSRREDIFKGVAVLIYVFAIDSQNRVDDIDKYKNCLKALQEYSPNAMIFVLVHKMDLIYEDRRQEEFENRVAEIKAESLDFEIRCFKTSIWDETLYKAWSNIVYELISNMKVLEKNLETLCSVLGADEVVLFEKSTFLVISHFVRVEHRDQHRFEKISNIIKQFKLSCGTAYAQFKLMRVENAAFLAYLDEFTTTTYLLVVMSDKSVKPGCIQTSIEASRAHFERIMQSGEDEP
mmetsp:Transcript_41956/g.48283  ORF Transcript_41956/g.48283 Transcript_41956/m.48283 type:complete len:312 (+) Transcript_41956:166-1101(+)